MELRSTSRVASSSRGTAVLAPAAMRSSIRTAAAPRSAIGWRTVVSGGVAQDASGMSSKPTTLRSSGTRRPRVRAASYAPIAMRSLQQKIALGLKQLSDDPWSKVHETYAIGQVRTGRVTRLADFGAFAVRLPRVAREHGIRINELTPTDESLESVFAYLVGA